MNLDIMYHANQFEAELHPARLERARLEHEAVRATAQRPGLTHLLTTLFRRAGERLQGAPDEPSAKQAKPDAALS